MASLIVAALLGLLAPIAWGLASALWKRRRFVAGLEKPIAPDLFWDGAPVTLSGWVVAEDASPGAAASTIERHAKDAPRTRRGPGRMRLAIGTEVVELTGEVRVVVGSREVWRVPRDMNLFLPALPAVERSVNTGDPVVARGVLRRVPSRRFSGYRTARAEWILENPRIAFAGTPRVRPPVRNLWRTSLACIAFALLAHIVSLPTTRSTTSVSLSTRTPRERIPLSAGSAEMGSSRGAHAGEPGARSGSPSN